MKDQKKIGISLSYISMLLSTIANIVVTPIIISALGDNDYSIYKVMQAFAGPLIMFNLGVATIVTRAIVRYNTLESCSLKEKQNTLALAMLTSVIMSVVVASGGVVMYFLIPSIYGANYTNEGIILGQQIFILFVFSTILQILTDVFSGCAVGRERFAFNSGVSLLRVILRPCLIVIFLKFGYGAIQVVAADCITAVIVFGLSAWYALGVLKERPRLTYIDRKELLEMLSFSAAILLQAIVNQVNNNVDTILLGAFVSEKSLITMYSSALVIYAAYNSLISVVARFFLPKATRLIAQNASGDELTDFVVKPGRFQAMVAVAIVGGFFSLGKDFISIWIGSQYQTAYYIVLILIIPVTIPLVENTAISILDATMKRIFRSVVLVVMAVINVGVSIVFMRYISYWGAALGTFVSLCVGHIFLMNLYYKKTFDMKIGRMFKEIFSGILPCGLVSAAIVFGIGEVVPFSIPAFFIKGFAFVILYGGLLLKFGLKDSEKKMIPGLSKICL